MGSSMMINRKGAKLVRNLTVITVARSAVPRVMRASTYTMIDVYRVQINLRGVYRVRSASVISVAIAISCNLINANDAFPNSDSVAHSATNTPAASVRPIPSKEAANAQSVLQPVPAATGRPMKTVSAASATPNLQ